MGTRCALALVLFAWAARAIAAGVAAPDYCLPVSTSPAPIEYAIRADGKYCDGAYYTQHRAGDLELVSITCGDMRPELPATIRTLVPKTIDSKTRIRLTGIALIDDSDYRLDAMLDSTTPYLKLDTKESSIQQQEPPLQPALVGWRAWIDTPQWGIVHLPVFDGNSCGGAISIKVQPSIVPNRLGLVVRSSDGTVLHVEKMIISKEKSVLTVTVAPEKLREWSGVLTIEIQVVGLTHAGPDELVVLRLALPEEK